MQSNLDRLQNVTVRCDNRSVNKGIKFDPRDQPAYTFSEAARYLRLPTATLRAWFFGYTRTSASGNPKRVPHLIKPCSGQNVSFFNVVEAHVLAAIRRDHKVPLYRVRSALDYTAKQLGVERPLLQESFETDGIDLFVTRLGALINASKGGQLAMRDVLQNYLQRVDRDAKGVPIKLYPFTTPNELNDVSRRIVINPLVGFGRLILDGTNVPVEVIADRYGAGDSISELATDYGLPVDAIETAVRVELLARKAA